MLEIIKQEENCRQGNDCLIKDCFTVIKCHDKYIVMNIRRYIGWCDNGTDFRSRKEFDNLDNALDYYNGELREVM